jgi:hypothetical protein
LTGSKGISSKALRSAVAESLMKIRRPAKISEAAEIDLGFESLISSGADLQINFRNLDHRLFACT